MKESISFFVILYRVLSSKCPVCGKGRLFAKFYKLQRFSELLLPLKTCDACSFGFARQPGYYFGVVTPVLPLLALTVGFFFAGIAYFAFHQERDAVLTWGGVGVATGLLLFFRTAIGVYIALDHTIDPPKPERN